MTCNDCGRDIDDCDRYGCRDVRAPAWSVPPLPPAKPPVVEQTAQGVQIYGVRGMDLHARDFNCDEYHCEAVVKASDYDAARAEIARLTEELRRTQDEQRSHDYTIAAQQARIKELTELLQDSCSKFSELYVTLATEDLSAHDLRELRTMAEQGVLAIDSALGASHD